MAGWLGKRAPCIITTLNVAITMDMKAAPPKNARIIGSHFPPLKRRPPLTLLLLLLLLLLVVLLLLPSKRRRGARRPEEGRLLPMTAGEFGIEQSINQSISTRRRALAHAAE